MIIPVILIFLAVIWLKVPGLVREKMWGELAAFTGLLLLGMVLVFGKLFRLPLPNPEHGLRVIFEPVTDFLFTRVLK